MDFLFGWLTDWLKQGLIDAIMGSFANIFAAVNNQIGSIAANVGQTPESWNSGVFAMIRTLSNTVVVPVAGIILTFVACYELIQLIVEKNNMQDFDTFIIFKWLFKTFCAVFILTHTFDIVMGIFDVAQNVVSQSAGIITRSLDINVALTDLQAMLEPMGIWELVSVWLELNIAGMGIWIMSICIFIIVYGRLIEIYLMVSVAPIPLSTMANHEWGQVGNNYLKSLFAIAFQGFLIMICVAIYAVLIQNIPTADNIHSAVFGTIGITVLLVFALFKTNSVSKAVFSAN